MKKRRGRNPLSDYQVFMAAWLRSHGGTFKSHTEAMKAGAAEWRRRRKGSRA